MRGRIFFLLALVFVLFSLFPTGYELANKGRLRPNRAFELVHNFPTDYNFYLSRIRQGIEGRWTVLEKYTSEPHSGSFLHVLYLWMGRVGQWVRVPWGRSGDVYHVGRIVFGMALLLLIAEYAKKSFRKDSEYSEDQTISRSDYLRVRSADFPKHRISESSEFSGKWQLLAFLLAVTASTWPKLVYVEVVPRFGGYMSWWSVMDSLQRITFIPHLLVGQALIVFLLLATSDERVMRRPGNWIFLGILAFLLGMVFPPGLVFVIATLGVLTILEALREKVVNKIAIAKILTTFS